MNNNTTVIESQLDWLTCSVEGERKQETLRLAAHRLMALEVTNGARVRPFRLNGYQGSLADRVRYGEREDRGLIQLSGDLAHKCFRAMYGRADHISRIDLAVTVHFPVYHFGVADVAYHDAKAFHADNPRSAQPRWVQDADGGQTFYLGDRSSDYFLRIYDKMHECMAHDDEDAAGRYHNCWRYELEVKGISAPGVAERLFDSPNPSGTIRGIVHNYQVGHGLSPAWSLDTPEDPLPGFRRRSDRDTRLAWLEKSVKPAVAWLLETGPRTDVLERLGLIDLAASEDPT